MVHLLSGILSDETLNRIIQIESAGKLKAKAPTSSALGLFQFLNATWLATLAKHRPDLLEGRTQAQALALRTDPTIGIEIGARFTEDNAAALGAGCTRWRPLSGAFPRLGTAKKFLRAKTSASAGALAGDAAVKANRAILAGRTAGRCAHGRRIPCSAAGKPPAAPTGSADITTPAPNSPRPRIGADRRRTLGR